MLLSCPSVSFNLGRRGVTAILEFACPWQRPGGSLEVLSRRHTGQSSPVQLVSRCLRPLRLPGWTEVGLHPLPAGYTVGHQSCKPQLPQHCLRSCTHVSVLLSIGKLGRKRPHLSSSPQKSNTEAHNAYGRDSTQQCSFPTPSISRWHWRGCMVQAI